jgi:O-antigen ligase
MWIELIEMIQERFLLGYGYGSFWLGEIGPSGHIYSIIPWAAPHAHNGFIELFLNGGLVLFLLFIFSFFVNVKRIKNIDPELKKSLKYFSISYLTFYLIYNFSESLIMVQNNIFWVIYVFITISLFAWQKKELQPALT